MAKCNQLTSLPFKGLKLTCSASHFHYRLLVFTRLPSWNSGPLADALEFILVQNRLIVCFAYMQYTQLVTASVSESKLSIILSYLKSLLFFAAYYCCIALYYWRLLLLGVLYLDYTPIGPRFSNLVLQALLVLLNETPPQVCRCPFMCLELGC